MSSVHCFGSEVGMDDYIRARSDVFFVGHDGSLRSNRVMCQLAGQYGVDLFIGSTLQMDADANTSTVTLGRLAGFGGAPNMGHDPHGRRHSTPSWLSLITAQAPVVRGRKLVVQLVETFKKGGTPSIVETLDAVEVGRHSGMPIAPVMIYGDDVSHVVTEEGIAYLYKTDGIEERRAAVAAIAGATPVGLAAQPKRTQSLRERGIVAYPQDLGVSPLAAQRSLLAARSIDDLVAWVGWSVSTPGPISELVMRSLLGQPEVRGLASATTGWRDVELADRAIELADRAVAALIAEALLTPKPALVDARGSGAHQDLTLDKLLRSARALHAGFLKMAQVTLLHAAAGFELDCLLRERLGSIGREAELAMLRATRGANAHRGAIWVLGLLVAATAMSDSGVDPESVAALAARIAVLPDRRAPTADLSNGARVCKHYGVRGARGEAAAGFPHVINLGLPALWRSRRRGADETCARLDALMAIMSSLDDTCLLHRGGVVALSAAQHGARAVLATGGTATTDGWNKILELDARLMALNASPGGCADLLAACIFLDG